MLQYHSIFLFNSWWAALQGKEGLFLVKIHAFSTTNSNYTPAHLKRDSRQCCFYSIHCVDGRFIPLFPLLLDVCKLTAVFLCPRGQTARRSGRLSPCTHLTSAGSMLECPGCAEMKSAPPHPAAFLAGKYSSQTEPGRLLSGWQLDMWGDILSWFQQWMPNAGHHSAPRRTHRNHTSLSLWLPFSFMPPALALSLFFLSPGNYHQACQEACQGGCHTAS